MTTGESEVKEPWAIRLVFRYGALVFFLSIIGMGIWVSYPNLTSDWSIRTMSFIILYSIVGMVLYYPLGLGKKMGLVGVLMLYSGPAMVLGVIDAAVSLLRYGPSDVSTVTQLITFLVFPALALAMWFIGWRISFGILKMSELGEHEAFKNEEQSEP